MSNGKDAVVRVPTVDLNKEYRSGIGYLTEIDIKLPAELIHLFSKETGENLLL